MIILEMNNTTKNNKFINILIKAKIDERTIRIITYESKNINSNDKFSNNWESFINNISKKFIKMFCLDSNILLTCIYTSLLYGYTIIRRNNKFKILVGVFLKLINNYLINFSSSIKILRNFLKEVLKNLDNFMYIYKTKVNTYDKWESWVVDVSEKDLKFLLKNSKTKSYYISYDILNDWLYINERCVNIVVDNINNLTDTLLTTGKFLQDNHIYELYNENLINIINDLQRDSYKIDVNLFINIFKDINLQDFLVEMYKSEFKLNIIDYYKHINININNYRSSHKSFNDEDFEINFLKYIHKNINDGYNNEYDKDYILDIGVINLLQHLYWHDSSKNIYTYLFIDYRGRLNVKGNISYVSSKLLRLIINLDKDRYVDVIYNDFTKYYMLSQIVNTRNINIEEGVIKYDNIISNLEINDINSIIKRTNFVKIYKNIGNTISLDATASMMQIIASLTSNTKLMLYTNLISGEDKKDIYDYIISIIIENLDENDTFYYCFSNRSLVKYSLMLYTYGSTPLFTAKKLIEDKKLSNIHIKDLTMLITKIINTFNNEFPVVKLLKSIVNKHVRKDKNCDYLKYRSILKNIKYTIPKNDKMRIIYNKYNIEFSNISKETDIKKIWKSAFVNIIHSLDSDVCILTRKDLMDIHKISSISIHDCFIVNINNYEKCLRSYNRSIKKVLEINISWIITDINVKDLEKLSKYNDYDFNNYKIEECKYSLKPE